MMWIDTIVQQIKATVADGVYEAIADGCISYSQEFDYGGAFIGVELMKGKESEVWVAHEDGRHQSPRIVEKVMDVLPDWRDVENEVMHDRWNSQDDFEVFGLYN